MEPVGRSQSDQNFDEAAFLAGLSRVYWDREVSRPIDNNLLVDDWICLFS